MKTFTTRQDFLKTTAWILGIYFISRLLYLAFLNPYFFAQFHYEELYRGLLGKELLSGLNFPIMHYRPDDYEGIWMLVAPLTAFFFQLLSPTVFSLKLTPFLFSTLALLFWFLTISLKFNKKVALYFSILFIFSAPAFVNFSLTNIGDSAETLFFFGASIYFFFKLLDSNKIIHAIFLGLCLGLGIWSKYVVSLLVPAILVFWCLQDKRFIFKKSFWLTFVFGIVGFSPWILTHTFLPLEAFDIHGRSLGSHFEISRLWTWLGNHRELIDFDLAESFGPAIWNMSFTLKKICMVVYSLFYILPILLWVIIRKKSETPKAKHPLTFFLIYTVIFGLVIQLSDFREARFFISFHAFIFVFVAVALSELKEKVALFFLGAIMLTSLLTNSPFLSTKHKGAVFKAKGYSYQFIDAAICKNYRDCLVRYDQLKDSLSGEDLRLFSTSLAVQAIDSFPMKYHQEEINEISEVMPDSFENYFYYFWGRKILEQKQTIDGAIRTLASVSSLSKNQIKKAMLGILDAAGSSTTHDLEDFQANLKPWMTSYYWRSRGQAWAMKNYHENQGIGALNKNLVEHIPFVPENVRAFFVQGVGKFLYHLWSNRPLNPYYDSSKIKVIFPALYHFDLFMGIGNAWIEREFEWRIADRGWYWKEFCDKLLPDYQIAILKGKKDTLFNLFQDKVS